jgi:hypothetical protein
MLRQLPIFERVPMATIEKIIRAKGQTTPTRSSKPRRRMKVIKGVSTEPTRGDLDINDQ